MTKITEFSIDYLSILKTQSKTENTVAMMSEIFRQLQQIEGVKTVKDTFGNYYCTKGVSDNYPAFVCHTDTVHKIYNTYTVLETEMGNLSAYTEDGGNFMQVGVGGDDKCGIIACLELLTHLPVVKCVFFLDEESGCKGSAASDITFFNDCRYAIEIDRKDSGDLITTGSSTELASPEFVSMMSEVGKKYDYKSIVGGMTDVVKLKQRGLKISACNLSAGYYNPHSKAEYIKKGELINVINYCLAVATIKTRYPHEYTPPKATTPLITRGYTASKDSTCLSCSTKLWLNEGVFCQQCIKHNLSLIIEENGETSIESEANPLCRTCGIRLLLKSELTTGFCTKCSFCSSCRSYLETDEEKYNTLCKPCDTEEDCSYCGHVLYTDVGSCFFCGRTIEILETEVCDIPGCENSLIYPEEEDCGVCNVCREDYQLEGLV